MILSNSNKFIYIHLEKCGGTSIKRVLEPHLKFGDILLGGTDFGFQMQSVYAKHFNDFLSMHSSAESILIAIGKESWNSMYKFATVRDPVEIVESLYFYSLNMLENYIKDNCEKTKDIKTFLESDTNFMNEKKEMQWMETFYISILNDGGINYFAQECLNKPIPAIVPQFNRLDSSVEIFDLKFLNKNWKYILNKIGINDTVPLHRYNNSQKNNKIFLEKDTILKIKEHFEPDYKNIMPQIECIWQ